MIYPIVLTLHIFIACATIAVIFGSLYAIGKENTGWYFSCAIILGILAAIEVLSGTAVAVLSPNLSVLQLTLHMTMYLAVCAATEIFLFMRIKKVSLEHA